MAHEERSLRRSRMRTVFFQLQKSLIKYVKVPHRFHVTRILKTVI